MKNNNQIRGFYLSALFLASQAVFAAPPPPGADAGTVYKELKDLNKEISTAGELKSSVEDLAKVTKNIVPLGTTEDLAVQVKSIQLLGDLPPGIKIETISEILMAPKTITRMSELKALAQKIEQVVHEGGYPLFKVTVPDQEIFNGRVRMLAYNGKIDKVVHVLPTKHRLDDELVQSYFTDLIETGGFKRLDFERTMLLLNDLPGVKARLILNPGEEPGLINADVEIAEGKLAQWTITADNFGADMTGRNRITALVKLNDLTGVGDRLSVMGNMTSRNLYAGIVEYKRPIGISGLVGSINAMVSDYQIGQNLVPLGVKGNSQSYEAGLSYPLILTFGRNLYADFSVADKHFSTTLADVSQTKNITVDKFGLRGSFTDSFLKGGTNFGNIYYYNGVVKPDQGFTDTTHQNYQKYTFAAVRNQSFVNGYSLMVSFSGQRTSDVLDSSEQASLGGATGVRAYGPSALFASKSNMLTAELSKDLGSAGEYGVIKSAVFYDRGSSLSDPVYGGTNTLQGAGLSLALQKWGFYEAKVTYAHRLGKSSIGNLQDDNSSYGRVWLSLLTFF